MKIAQVKKAIKQANHFAELFNDAQERESEGERIPVSAFGEIGHYYYKKAQNAIHALHNELLGELKGGI